MARMEATALGALAEVIAGQSPDGQFYNQDGNGLPFYQGKKDFGYWELQPPTKWTTQVTKEALPGDILMSVRAPVGPVNFTREKVCIGRGLAAIRCRSGMDADFLFYQLLGMQDRIAGKEGAVFASINKAEIEALPIVAPPLSEQRRIVAVLDEAFEAIATAKANTEKSLTSIEDGVYAAQRVFLASGSGEWSCTTLGQIGKVSMCKRVFKEETSTAGDIPFYKIGTFGGQPDAFISKDMYERYRSRFSFPAQGSILISAAGTIGRRVRYDGQPAYFQDSNIVWIENDESLVLNDYLYHFYGCCEWNSTTGATISRLYNDDLRRISVSFPKAITEQRQIATRLDLLLEEKQGLVSLYARKLAALDELKKSLLHQAFSGQLTAKSTDQQLATVA